jgi:hypothetical protein
VGTKNVTVTETKTVTVRTCDACGKEVHSSDPKRCEVCRREVGYCCGVGTPFYDRATEKDATPYCDSFVTLCKPCLSAGGAYLSAIRGAAAGCDREIGANVAAWRAWVREKAERGE